MAVTHGQKFAFFVIISNYLPLKKASDRYLLLSQIESGASKIHGFIK